MSTYKWVKKGAIDFNGEVIIPEIGSDVTELVASLDGSVVKNLLADKRIVDDTEEREKNARLIVDQQKKIDAAVRKAAKKAAKKAESVNHSGGGGRSK